MTNPLIEKSRSILPGTTFALPSRGVFYDDTVLSPDVIDGEVLVYPMRLKEELALKSLDALFQGTAVTDAIKYCVPQVLDPDKLITDDIDYLLTVIKMQTHGNIFKYRIKCLGDTDIHDNINDDMDKDTISSELSDESRTDTPHSYEEFSDNDGGVGVVEEEIVSEFCEFDIPLDHFLSTCKPINPETVHDNMIISFKNFTIHTRPLTFKDVRDISLLRLEDREDMTQVEYAAYASKFSDMNLFKRIEKVDDIEDRGIIEEWVSTLTLGERTEIFGKIADSMDWGINFSYTVHCDRCGVSTETDQSYLNPVYFFLT